MPFPSFKKNVGNIKRANEIIGTIAKYGLADIFERTRLYDKFKLKKSDATDADEKIIKKLSTPERARLALQELGPTFVKFGQVLSTRPDLIPDEYIAEFSKLQDNVPPFPPDNVRQLVSDELKKAPEDAFDKFEAEPFAAASLSQVHLAELKGKRIAVKIQRPGIRKVIDSDIAILYELAKFASGKIELFRIYKPVEIIDEFARTIRNELDFVNEARSIDKFKMNFRQEKYIRFPHVYWKYTTGKIITMSYIEGKKLSNLLAMPNPEYDYPLIAQNYSQAILKQIFIDGFFHADPHPGNVFVMKDNSLALLDFGMVGRLEDSDKDNLADLFMSVINSDADKIISTFEEMDIITPDTDLKPLRRDLKEFVDRYYGLPLKDIAIGKIMEEIVALTLKHNVSFPSEFALLVKSLITLEGILRSLDPDFNLAEKMEFFAARLLKEKYSVSRIAKKAEKIGRQFTDLAAILPDELAWLLKSLRKGELSFNIRLKGLENLLTEIDRASNRLAFSLIIAAIIIGSSQIIQLNKGPFIFGYPIVGILGFLIAGILGLGLVVDIIWRGKLK